MSWSRVTSMLAAALTLASVARADLRDEPRELYGRLIAPCCWNQTLDIHDSELATTLRVEIAARLELGEAPLAVEDDLAARYGERIRAVPRAEDPRQTMAIAVTGTMVAALAGLLLLALRWMRRRTHLEEQLLDEYDARLDRELARD